MIKRFLLYSSIVILAVNLFSSCQKETQKETNSSNEYTTGFFTFTYTDTLFINGTKVLKDTTVQFTSVGNNPAEKEHYGYFDPARLQTHIGRYFESDFQFMAYAYLEGININAITYPYTFMPAVPATGQVSATFFFIKGGKDTIIAGSPTYVNNTYFASASNVFSFTLKSKQNGRLIGNFSGILENTEGRRLTVRDGAFDIKLIER